MINNKELIKPLLIFPKKDDSFYFVQILQRKKDHKGETLGGSNNNSRLVKAYHLNSIEKLEYYWEEMVKLAEVFEARVSINLNPRSFEKAGFQLLSKVAYQMENKDFYNIRRAYDSICGNYHAEMDKRWIIDIDNPDQDVAVKVIEFVESIQKNDFEKKLDKYKKQQNKVLALLPSRSGWHVITQPFNVEIFALSHHKEHEIHKNNPTNLYIP